MTLKWLLVGLGGLSLTLYPIVILCAGRGDFASAILLIGGLSLMTVVSVEVGGWLAPSVAVFVAASLVAPEGYLLAIAHILRGADAPFSQYVEYQRLPIVAAGESAAKEVARLVCLQSAERPLWALADGSESYRSLVERYRTKDFFLRDMDVLRASGVVDLGGGSYDEAELTEVGRVVADLIVHGFCFDERVAAGTRRE